MHHQHLLQIKNITGSEGFLISAGAGAGAGQNEQQELNLPSGLIVMQMMLMTQAEIFSRHTLNTFNRLLLTSQPLLQTLARWKEKGSNVRPEDISKRKLFIREFAKKLGERQHPYT